MLPFNNDNASKLVLVTIVGLIALVSLIAINARYSGTLRFKGAGWEVNIDGKPAQLSGDPDELSKPANYD